MQALHTSYEACTKANRSRPSATDDTTRRYASTTTFPRTNRHRHVRTTCTTECKTRMPRSLCRVLRSIFSCRAEHLTWVQRIPPNIHTHPPRQPADACSGNGYGHWLRRPPRTAFEMSNVRAMSAHCRSMTVEPVYGVVGHTYNSRYCRGILIQHM